MDIRSSLLKSELSKLLQEELQRKGENILIGSAYSDLWQYKEACGYIAGLRKAFELIDEAETNVNKRQIGN